MQAAPRVCGHFVGRIQRVPDLLELLLFVEDVVYVIDMIRLVEALILFKLFWFGTFDVVIVQVILSLDISEVPVQVGPRTWHIVKLGLIVGPFLVLLLVRLHQLR